MQQLKHNPDYKLIGVRINNKEFVYGETNNGNNKGLEVFYYKGDAIHFYYSRRFSNSRLIPMSYDILYKNLESLINAVLPGHKLTLVNNDYSKLFNCIGNG